MATGAELGLWEQFEALEASRAAWEVDVAAKRESFREGTVDQITGNAVQDIVVALHGVEGIIKPKILAAWNGLAERFDGAEEEPFLVVERSVGTAEQNYNLRPAYWVGTVPESPLNYRGRDLVTLSSSKDFTIATMFSGSRKRAEYTAGSTGNVPVLAERPRFVRVPEEPLTDRVLTELDQPIKSKHDSVGSDFKPYRDLFNNWFIARERYHHPKEYPVKHPIKQMSMLEVVVGEREIRKWARGVAVGDEKEIVTQALRHQIKQKRQATEAA